MALASNTHWEVRTTGDDSNGGAFNVSSSGTDYSQQDSAQYSYSDLTIGATTTQLSSSSRPFTSADVGNVINITGGTGFNVQRVQINSVASGVATCDRSCGASGSTGGVGQLGGALASVGAAASAAANQNTIWIQTGTYNVSASVNINNSYAMIGYGSTRGDNGASPTINMTADGTILINTWTGGAFVWLHNLIFTTSASVKSYGVGGGASETVISRCSFTGFSNAINLQSHPLTLIDSYISGCTGNAIVISGQATISNCVIRSSGDTHIVVPLGSTGFLHITRSLLVDGANAAIFTSSSIRLTVDGCTIANNGNDGINLHTIGAPSSTVAIIESSIFWGNSLYAVKSDSPSAVAVGGACLRNNALGNNGSGNYSNLPTSSGDVALTADPFTNSSAGDYSLNDTAGGGAACKGFGFPGAFPDGTTTGTLDIGAVNSGSGGGGGGTTPANYCFVG